MSRPSWLNVHTHTGNSEFWVQSKEQWKWGRRWCRKSTEHIWKKISSLSHHLKVNQPKRHPSKLLFILWIIIIMNFFCLPATVMTLLSPPKFTEESSFIVELFLSKKTISMVVEVCFFPYKFASSFIYWLEYVFLSPPLLPYLTFVSSLTRISQIKPSVMILPCSVMEENVWCVHFPITVVVRPLPEHTKTINFWLKTQQSL